jgi:hypothetical protein
MSDYGVLSEMLLFVFPLKAPLLLPVAVSVSVRDSPIPANPNPCKALRANTNFTRHFNVIWVVQIARRKYSASHFPQISSIFAPSRLIERGVRVVTIRGVRVAVDAMALRARGVAGRSQACLGAVSD